MQTKTKWTALIERVKGGETTEEDADTVARIQQAIADLRGAYPGYEYFAPLARILAFYDQLEATE